MSGTKDESSGDTPIDSTSIVSTRVSNTEKDLEALDQPPISRSQAVETDRTIHGFKWFLVCISLYFSCLIYGLDATIAADIQGAVLESFDEISKLTWLGTAFPMASLCSILPAAMLYTLFDLKILFISCIAAFEVGSAICGAAPSMNVLIVGRALAGFGGSGIVVGILNFFVHLTTHTERALYMSGMGLVWGGGAVLGPVIGGAFSSSSATWRWCFYINLIIAAICAPIYVLYLPSIHPIPASARPSILSRLFRIDLVGMLLTTGAIITLVMALTFGGSTWAWNDDRTIVLFVVFAVLLILSFLQQYFNILTTSETCLIPTNKFLRTKPQILLYIGSWCSYACLFIPLYYIPLYFQFVHGDNAIKAAIRLLPFVVVMVFSNLLSGYLLPKIKIYAALYLISGVLIILGSSLMYTIQITSASSLLYGYSVLIAFGSGLIINTGYAVAGIKVALGGGDGKDVQAVMSLQTICTVSGTMLPLLISGQVFQSVSLKSLERVLGGKGFSEAELRSLIGGAGSVVFRKLTDGQRLEATSAITEAISKVYILGIITGCLALGAGLLMKWERLF